MYMHGNHPKFHPAEFGLRLAGARKAKGLTQEDLAELLGISRNHVSSMENGKKVCSLDLLVELSGRLSVSTDYLLTGKKTDVEEIRDQIIAAALRL